MKYTYIPVQAQTAFTSTAGTFMAANATVFQNSTRGKSGSFELQTQVGFPIYGITIMTFVGCFMVCFYLPTGMWAYVFDYIGAWQQRPKPMNEVDFNR
jgi:hypothetical protein